MMEKYKNKAGKLVAKLAKEYHNGAVTAMEVSEIGKYLQSEYNTLMRYLRNVQEPSEVSSLDEFFKKNDSAKFRTMVKKFYAKHPNATPSDSNVADLRTAFIFAEELTKNVKNIYKSETNAFLSNDSKEFIDSVKEFAKDFKIQLTKKLVSELREGYDFVKSRMK